MKLEKRIRALEAKMLSDPLIFHFADGSVKTLTGGRHFLVDLLVRSSSPDLNPAERAQLDLIYESVSAEKPGGGHLVEMMQSVMGESVEEGFEVSIYGRFSDVHRH